MTADGLVPTQPASDVPGTYERHRLRTVDLPFPVLVGCSSRTNDPARRDAIRLLLQEVRAASLSLVPGGVEVRDAFLGGLPPLVDDVVAGAVAAGRPRCASCGRDR